MVPPFPWVVRLGTTKVVGTRHAPLFCVSRALIFHASLWYLNGKYSVLSDLVRVIYPNSPCGFGGELLQSRDGLSKLVYSQSPWGFDPNPCN